MLLPTSRLQRLFFSRIMIELDGCILQSSIPPALLHTWTNLSTKCFHPDLVAVTLRSLQEINNMQDSKSSSSVRRDSVGLQELPSIFTLAPLFSLQSLPDCLLAPLLRRVFYMRYGAGDKSMYYQWNNLEIATVHSWQVLTNIYRQKSPIRTHPKRSLYTQIVNWYRKTKLASTGPALNWLDTELLPNYFSLAWKVIF